MKGATGLTWVKSTYSSGEGGQCVEVATRSQAVYVRDSKDPAGPALAVGQEVWVRFVGYAAEQNH